MGIRQGCATSLQLFSMYMDSGGGESQYGSWCGTEVEWRNMVGIDMFTVNADDAVLVALSKGELRMNSTQCVTEES